MSLIPTLLILNKLKLPKEIINMIKDYVFRIIQKFHVDDIRYNLLLSIPEKEYYDDNETCVHIGINYHKEFYLSYYDNEFILQTVQYFDNNYIKIVEEHSYIIK